MTKARKNQTLVTTWGRFILGAFVFGWLNAAAQPCMMAMNLAAEPEAMSAHAGHDMSSVAEDSHHKIDGDCGHCPPVGAGGHQSNCASIQAVSCNDMSSANVDSRQLKFELKDAPGMFAVSHAPPQARSFRPASFSAPHPCVHPGYSDGPSISLRYCVFLK